MIDEPSIWTWRDTVVVLSAFGVPLATSIAAFLFWDEWAWGTWSSIELNWTVLGAVGTALCTFKSWLLVGDLLGVWSRGWRYILGAWWSLANVLGLGFAFTAWTIVGWTAGQFPSSPTAVTGAARLPIAVINGTLFMSVEAILLGVITFGLLARVRLAE